MWVDSWVISILIGHLKEKKIKIRERAQKNWKFQRLLRETDIEGNQLITVFAEREDERVGRR